MLKILLHLIILFFILNNTIFATELTMKNKSLLNPSSTHRFQDKVIFITGGTSGIGLATAIQFAAEGAKHVIVCGRLEEKWKKAQASIQKHLSRQAMQAIEYWPCDVRIESEMQKIIATIYDKYQRLDVAFNNAGVAPGIGDDAGDIEQLNFHSRILEDGSIAYIIPPPQPLSTKSNLKWQAQDKTQASRISPYRENPIATSIFGTFYSMKWELIYAFKRQPKNLPMAIINNASRTGIIPDPNRPLYAASKAFIIALSKSLSNQVAQKAMKAKRAMVRINVVAPGPVDTPLERGAFPGDSINTKALAGVPMQRIAVPEEIAQAVLFLADETTASYITGAVLPVDGGHVASPYISSIKK